MANSEWRIGNCLATIRYSPLALGIERPNMDAGQLEGRKARVKAWFERLRDDICAALEALEGAAPAALHGDLTGRFVHTPWTRTDTTGAAGGGGVMAMMTGRLFEKVGVHVSTVFGEF